MATCAVWGGSFTMVKQSLDDSSVLLFLALRFSLAAVLLALLFRRRGAVRVSWAREWRAGFFAGGCLFAGYLLQTWGMLSTTATNAAFLTGLNVVMVPLLASLVYRRVPQISELAGVLLAGGGMALLTLPGPSLQINAGDVLCFGCAIAFSAHILVVGHYAQQRPVENLALLQIVVVALLSLSSFWWAEPVHIRWTPGLLFAVGFTAVFATALAFSIMVWAQRYTSPTRAALIFALEPVFAWATNYVLLGERLRGSAAIGAVLILVGILVVELKPIGMGRHPSS